MSKGRGIPTPSGAQQQRSHLNNPPVDLVDFHTRFILLEQSLGELTKKLHDLAPPIVVSPGTLSTFRSELNQEHQATKELQERVASFAEALQVDESHTETLNVLVNGDSIRLRAHEDMIKMLSQRCGDAEVARQELADQIEGSFQEKLCELEEVFAELCKSQQAAAAEQISSGLSEIKALINELQSHWSEQFEAHKNAQESLFNAKLQASEQKLHVETPLPDQALEASGSCAHFCILL